MGGPAHFASGLHRRLDGLGGDGEAADAGADGVEDRVADRRRDDGDRRLACAPPMSPLAMTATSITGASAIRIGV